MFQRAGFMVCMCLASLTLSGQHSDLFAILSETKSNGAADLEGIQNLLRRFPEYHRAHQEFHELARRIGRVDEATNFYQSWLQDERLAGYAQYGLARIRRGTGDSASAEQHAAAARSLVPDFAFAHIEWLASMQALGKLAQAESMLLAESLQGPNNAAIRYALGMQWHRTKPSEALALLSDAHHLRPNDPVILDGVIRAMRYLHRYREAAAASKKLLELALAHGDREWQREALSWLGAFESDLGEYTTARRRFEEALAINADLGAPDRSQRLHHELAVVDYFLGYHEAAIMHLQQALSIAEQRQDVGSKGRLLGILATVYADQPHYRRAILTYNDALELAREAKDQASEADILANLSRIHLELADPTSATTLISRALAIAREQKNTWLEARLLSIEGQAHAGRRNFDEALRSYDLAAQLALRIGDRFAAAQGLFRTAQVKAAQHKYAMARNRFASAEKAAREMNALALTAEIRIELGRLDIVQRRWASATELLNSALEAAKQLRSRQLMAMAHAALGDLKYKRFDRQSAADHYVAAIDAVEQTRISLVAREDRAAYLSSRIVLFKRAVACLMRLRRTREAFALADRSRARSHLESVINPAQNPPVEDDEERNLRARLSQAQAALAAAQTRSATEVQLAALRRTVTDSADLYQIHVWNQRQRSAPAMAYEAMSLSPLQSALPRDTLIIEYCLDDSASWLFVVSRRNVSAYVMPPGHEIEANVAEVRQLLTSGPGRGTIGAVKVRAADLYHKLLGPVARDLSKFRKLIVIADGLLQTLPFELLLPDPASDGYLIRSHTIEYAPSASTRLLAWKGTKAPKRVLAIGDPDYGESAKRLIHSRREVEKLSSRSDSTLLLGAEATEGALRKHVQDHRILHLAVHAETDWRRPELSSLRLTPRSDSDPDDDGLLQAYEIVRLPVAAELVVLSACDAGVGRELKGEGAMSLASAFLSAGARQVATSLWKVEDRATTELMTRFHKRLPSFRDVSAAMRSAKRSLLDSEMWNHPFYWASMVVISGSRS